MTDWKKARTTPHSFILHLRSETDASKSYCGRELPWYKKTGDFSMVDCANYLMAKNWSDDGGRWKHAKKTTRRMK